MKRWMKWLAAGVLMSCGVCVETWGGVGEVPAAGRVLEAKAAPATVTVQPLLGTHWGQGGTLRSPFSWNTPGGVPAGSGPVALAQILAYYDANSYLANTNRNASLTRGITIVSNGVSSSVSVSVSLPSWIEKCHLPWRVVEAVPDTPSGMTDPAPAYEDQVNVGRLLRICGNLAGATYDLDNRRTTIPFSKLAEVLKGDFEFLGTTGKAIVAAGESDTQTTWTNAVTILRTEIAIGRPVALELRNGNGGSLRHIVLADGLGTTGSGTSVHLALCDTQGTDVWVPLASGGISVVADGVTYSVVSNILYDMRPNVWMSLAEYIQILSTNLPPGVSIDDLIGAWSSADYEAMTAATVLDTLTRNALASCGFMAPSIKVDWRPYKEGVTYTISRETAKNPDGSAGSGSVTLTTAATGVSWEDETAEPGVLYRYSVVRNSDQASMACPTNACLHILPPSNLTVTATAAGVILTWTPAVGAYQTAIYRAGPFGTPEEAAAADLDSLTFLARAASQPGVCTNTATDVSKGYYRFAIRSLSLHTGLSGWEGDGVVVGSDSIASITIAGAASVIGGSNATYTCVATWMDGTKKTVVPTWSLVSGNSYGSISSIGVFTAKETDTARSVTIQASYAGKNVRKTVSISISPGFRLSSLSIEGPSAVVPGGTATYDCKATYGDGTSRYVTPTWSLVSGAAYGSITSGGVFTANAVETPQNVTIQAAYGEKSVTKVVALTMGTGISGTVSRDETWSAGGVYLVTGNLTVSNGATLTIEPGAVVKFSDGVSLDIAAGAALDARGTLAKPIVFTSLKDDVHGGDTNGDGGATVAQPGDWKNLKVGGRAVLEHVSVLYGGGESTSSDSGMLTVPWGGTLSLDGCTVAHGAFDGVFSYGKVEAGNTAIWDCDRGVNTAGGSGVFRNCVIDQCRWGAMAEGGDGTYYNCIITRFRGASEWPTGWGLALWSGSLRAYNCCVWSELPGAENYRFSPTVACMVLADPRFADADSGDFRIAADSPCVDAANTMQAPAVDCFGSSRMDVESVADRGTPNAAGVCADIGIYEVPGRTPGPMPDLDVESVSAQETLTVGGTASVTWTVRNVGTGAADGTWRDEIEIVAANGRVQSMGTARTTAAIPVGGSASFTAEVPVPSVPEGLVRVRVTANKHHDLFEGYSMANNANETKTELAVPTVAVPSDGDSVQVQISADGQTGFALPGPGAESALLVIRAPSGLDAWLGDGSLAVRENALRTAVQVADGTWLVQIPAGSEPRVTLANDTAEDMEASLSLAVGSFLLFDAGGVTAANVGIASVPFAGNGFADGMSCWIEKGGIRIDASSLVVESGVNAVATFDVEGCPAGLWTLHISREGGSASLEFLTLAVPDRGAVWHGDVDIPASIRAGRTYVGNFRYGNGGDIPTNAPYVRLEAKGDTLIRLGESDAWGRSVEFLAASDTYPASLLKAGDSSGIPFQYKTTGSAAEIEYSLAFSPSDDFPWAEAATGLRPSWATDELWGFAFATLRANFGETWASYLDRLRADCDHLMEIGSPVKRIDRLLRLELNDALGIDTAVPVLASATDIARTGRGMGLVLSRSYASSLRGRLSARRLGYGWTDNHSTYAERLDDETLLFHLPGGSSYSFTKASGTWQPEDARDKTVLEETASAYVLTYRDGTVQTVAKSNMRTSSIRDNRGNTLSFTWSGTLLKKVAHSDGQTLTFTHSGGKLVKAADDRGRTVSYGYTGGLLTSVTAFDGLVTRYEYHAADGTPCSRALERIVHPDGTTTEFGYDARGLLSAVSANGGQQRTEIVRGACGSYSVVAPNGAVTEVIVGACGETLRNVDALGRTVRQTYAEDMLLESIISPGGRRSTLSHDRDGNPVTVSSASGATAAFSYDPVFGKPASVTDAKGHAFAFEYDEFGFNTSVAHADGSVARAECNARGDVVKATNRRGETVVFEYDAEGNLVKKTWPDGRTFTFAYDTKGNLTNATDSVTGTVTMEYEANERLTRIVHPKGRGFTFAYDSAGRMTERTSLDGAVERFAYDDFGRLASVTDGSGNAYLTNTYDPQTGWLVTQTYGNGTVVSNAYDLLGRTVGIYHLKGGKRLAFFEYAYDEDGRCISQTTAEGVERYTYDADGQLTAVSYPDGTSERFAYDAVGNRTEYTVNELNQYLSGNGATFTYDADGNMTSRTGADGTTVYIYDTLNRLVAVTNEAKGIRWSCEYDVFGNRTRVIDNGTTTERLFVQGALPSVAAEYVNDSLAKRHVLVGAVRIADVATTSGASRYYHGDLIGSARLLTDGNGKAKGTRAFKAFGETRKSSGETADAGYVGTLGIETDPTGLLFMRNRYYDAKMRRFVQMDPIMLSAGDINLYRYSGNSPICNIDPCGFFSDFAVYFAESLGLGSGASVIDAAGEIYDSNSNVSDMVERKIVDSIANHILGNGVHKPSNGYFELKGAQINTANRIKTVGRGLANIVKIYNISDFSGEFGAYILKGDTENAAQSVETYVLNSAIKGLMSVGMFGGELIAWGVNKFTSKVVQSWDPNEMSGPAGLGEQRYVAPGEWMDYTIYFENKTNATAAAQEVFVDLPMDPNLDWSTLELGEIAFGEHIDMGLCGKKRGTTSYAIPGKASQVRSKVSMQDDVLSWYIRDWYPETADNFPANAEGGFLPPNDVTHRGEGRISYRVKVKENAVPGSVIRASASIVFDYNAAIETDPAWWNTVAELGEATVETGNGEETTVTVMVGAPWGGQFPDPGTRDGERFSGWFTGPDGTGERVTDETVVVAGVKLYAFWEAAPGSDVRVEGLSARQRYPWNGLVDIDYEVTGTGRGAADTWVEVAARDAETGNAMPVWSLSGDGAYGPVAAGSHRLIWDMGTDRGPEFVSDALAITMTARRGDPAYLVVDMSGGRAADHWPVGGLPGVPAGGWTDEYKTTKLVLRRVEAGLFAMGSPEDEPGRAADETRHTVRLTQTYWLGVFEVTQKQWELAMGNRPAGCPGDTRPVEGVSYRDVRGRADGAKWPASGGVDAESFLGVLREKTGMEFDLPTEAQWEHACRAGSTTALNSGKAIGGTVTCPNLGEVAKYAGNGAKHGADDGLGGIESTHAPVGSYRPNAWGMHDLHGNVAEWCLDWIGDYAAGIATDPVGASSGVRRAVRGGSWDDSAMDCRSAARGESAPGSASDGIGLRLCWGGEEIPNSLMEQQIEWEPIGTQVVGGTLTLTATASGGGMVTYEVVSGPATLEGSRLTFTGTGMVVVKATQAGDETWASVWAEMEIEVREPLYMVLDLSGGTNEVQYGVSYLADLPEGGWTDEYKTSKLVLRRIEPGAFTMGSPTNETGRLEHEMQHTVMLTEPYWMGVFEVTQRQWELVMGNRPAGYPGDMRPVEQVSQNDIRGASAGQGWPESDEVDAESFMGRLRARTGVFLWNLPTEAQWEHACRAGTTSELNSGKDLTSITNCVNMAEVGRYGYDNGYLGGTADGNGGYSGQHTTVGSYVANAWGLYDMHGNVWEWCLDRYGNYAAVAVTNPMGPTYGSNRVCRGGSWVNAAAGCRSAHRASGSPAGQFNGVGFRLACPVRAVRPQGLQWSNVGTQLVGGTLTLAATATGGGAVGFELVAGPATLAGNVLTFTGGGTVTVRATQTGNATWGAVWAEMAIAVQEPLYMVLDLSGGTNAVQYGVSYLANIPEGGWTDEYKTTKLVLRRIEPGTFTMGSPTNELGRVGGDIEVQHTVKLSAPYWMGVFEVTQKQWELVMGTRPSYFTNASCYAKRPVECVSYNDIRGAAAGAGWPENSEVDPTSFMGRVRGKAGGFQWDLPTEAQWENACRAGMATALNSGKNLTGTNSCPNMAEVGRYLYNGGENYTTACDTMAGTSEAGSYLPNSWGLYDMHGNVYEWCLDWKQVSLGTETVTNPAGPASGTARIVRSGCWANVAMYCRSASRINDDPSIRYAVLGFRLCCHGGTP